ncbi:high mobility group protein 20A-like [Mytilus edulis]|uniref:high mobility group protein 20A-like n=1 Tax=Mytilus edulis TaxID=6550 RepID=UPI0039F0C721
METSLTELHDGAESLGCLNEHDKPEIPIVGILPTSSTQYSLPQNCLGIVLVDTSSRNVQLAADLNGVSCNYSNATELPGTQLVQSTIAIPGIFQQVTPSEIDEEHVNHVYSTTHVGNVCEDSLDGRHLIQQNQLTNTTNLQNGLKKQEGPVKKKGGWPKGKKRKEVPELITPKAPPTGYVLFAMQRRLEIKEEHPEVPFSQVTKLLGHEWTALDLDKKQKYLDEADELKKKYIEEMKIFKESDAYKNLMKKKRKASENGLHEGELEGSTKSSIEEEMNCLFCEICDMYFTSAHNKKEHMFGRQHLQNISGEIRRQSTEKNKQKQTELFDTTEYSDSEQTMSDGPVDIQGFINSFRAQNHEREIEISRLRHTVKLAREENASLYKQIEEFKMYENRLSNEVEANKQYCQNIISQTETLKMISSTFSAMFGILNFEV